MNASTCSRMVFLALWACALLATPVSHALAVPFLDGFSFFAKRDIDPAIPESHRRSFKSSRNDIVMVFEGTHWHSLTRTAATGSTWQQREFCEALTRSDRQVALIPRGFQYTPGGDGRIYLVKTDEAPGVADRAPAMVEPQRKETVRRAIYSTPSKPSTASAHAQKTSSNSYRTALGNVLMVAKGDNWEGRAPEERRGSLSAPAFCEKAAAQDRLKGRLPHGYTYVLMADDTLVALPRSSRLARLADAR